MEQKNVVNGETPFLPQEIIKLILVQLLVKSLIRFRCVCKNWKNLFKTPSFIKEHLRHSCKSPCLLLEGISPSYNMLTSFLDHEMQFVDVQSLSLVNSLSITQIVGSYNGFICLQPHGVPMILWNPSIRETRHVSEGIDFSVSWTSFVGFGFSSVDNDYKIVKTPTTSIKKVQVYSLSTGAWKDVEVGNLDGVRLHFTSIRHKGGRNGVALCSESYGITTNGAIFWFGCKNVGEGLK